MGRFVNSKTGVVVSVADDKDERFASPLWEAYDGSDTNRGSESKTRTAQSKARGAGSSK